jgi:hypothetical protein
MIEAAFEAAVLALGVFDRDDARKPGLMEETLGVGEQAIETEPAQVSVRGFEREVGRGVIRAHRSDPSRVVRNHSGHEGAH